MKDGHSQGCGTGTERRSRGRPPDPAKREAILTAARDLFFGGGLQCLSIEAVARRAGVSKVTVYAHFTDLQGLIRALILAQRASVTAVLDGLPGDQEGFRQGLIDFGVSLMVFLTGDEYLTLLRMLTTQAAQQPWLGPLVYQEGALATRNKVANLLASAIERGDLHQHDTEQSAEQLLGMWQGFQTSCLLIGGCPQPTKEALRQRVERAVDIILAAYAPAGG